MSDQLRSPEEAEAAAVENIKGALKRLLQENKQENGGQLDLYGVSQGLETVLSRATGEKVTSACSVVLNKKERFQIVFENKAGESKTIYLELDELI